jgi:protein-tyrosine phosphatase
MDSEYKTKVKCSSPVDFDQILDNLSEEEIREELDFIGLDPIKIKTTNAQDIYNQYQIFPRILVFDLRSMTLYKTWHLKWSINFPVDILKDNSFINFDPEKIDKFLILREDKEAFNKRKRSMCFIVAHQNSTSRIFPHLADLFDLAKIKELKTKFSSQDILATRNSILLYKALKKDKTREVYICRNSFNAIESKFPFMCRFDGSSLYQDPLKTNGYPSEILDRRLYLGDKSHAQSSIVLHNLGITHILNVTNCVPNKFEDSKDHDIIYQKINIEDKDDVPINLSFSLASDFIDGGISPKKHQKFSMSRVNFDLLQSFNDPNKKAKAQFPAGTMTNTINLDLGNKCAIDEPDVQKDTIYQIDMLMEKNLLNSNNQHRVLVHCAMGRSRSATMVIMYLMKKFDISMEIAFRLAKTRREVVDPNEGFLKKLEEYETELYDKKSLSLILKSHKLSTFKDDNLVYSSSSEDLMETKSSIDI